MSTTRYYQDQRGAAYRLTSHPATPHRAAILLQARRSPHSAYFGPEYPTTETEVDRLIEIGFFVPPTDPTPCP